MPRYIFALALAFALVTFVGVSALLDTTGAGPLHGKGRGTCKPNPAHCRFCPPPEPGCSLFECTKCGCDYVCGDTLVSVPRSD